MVTLDTNIIIALFQGDGRIEQAIRSWQEAGIPLVTSTITLTELLAFPRITKSEEKRLKAFLFSTRAVPVSWRIAELAGYLRQKYRIRIADALISATAWHETTTLTTRNLRDFRRVREIAVESL